MENQNSEGERVVEVRRRGGKLREIMTSMGRRFLVLNIPQNERLLEVGAVLGRKEIKELESPLALAAAFERAYRLLATRDRTEWEIRTALAEDGIEISVVIDDVVETLRRQGYLDDRRLASDFIRYTTERRPSGPHLLRQKLLRVGVSRDVIEDEIRSALSLEREKEIALKLARKKLNKRVETKRAVRNIGSFLTRRGFNSSTVNDICARILRGEITGEDDEQRNPIGA